MKKVLSILCFLVVLSITTIIMAADVNVVLNTSVDKVIRGEEFTVVIALKDFAIEGENKAFEASINYDKEKLEYVEHKFLTSWSGSLSSDKTRDSIK